MLSPFLFVHCFFFFFNDTATTEIYTLSLHDALPISSRDDTVDGAVDDRRRSAGSPKRSEEHTSELQSLAYLVCRLLLEKKNKPHREGARTESRNTVARGHPRGRRG